MLPKPRRNRSKIDSRGLSETIVDQYMKRVRFRTLPKRPRVAQDRPQDVLDPPKPTPNGAQDPPQIRFYGYFWMFGPQSKFA